MKGKMELAVQRWAEDQAENTYCGKPQYKCPEAAGVKQRLATNSCSNLWPEWGKTAPKGIQKRSQV